MKLQLRDYIRYKFLNSLFFGISIGSIFVIYAPIEPATYSIGGILLAVCMLFVAKLYGYMMHIKVFFYITIFIESTVLLFVGFFLLFGYSYMTAISIYIGYQVTFIFGNYLVRIETITLKKTAILSFVDVAKQRGYLFGMIASYGFYKVLEYLHVHDKKIQIYDLHVALFILQIFILYFVFRAFYYRG
ncbi:MAG: hypothetical protein JJV95_06505 [Sulfurospirillum sp.]|nr:hypothetical protein [Sulfurospirillum sp.]